MRRLTSALTAVVALAGCGDEKPKPVAAGLPMHPGQLGALCPPPDVPPEFYESRQRNATRQIEALIREVRRNPRGVVEVVSQDADTGEKFRYRRTVRELAEQHLEYPGVRGVPCARSKMLALQAAVDGRPAPRNVEDERVFTIAEIVEALGLRKDGALYRGPDGCEVDVIYAGRSELGPVLRDGAAANHELLTDPGQSLGLEVYRPTAACRRELERRLAALDR
jgi:hypothetical protein